MIVLKKIFILLFILGVAIHAFGQEKGFLRGHITDGDMGGSMIGATVVLADNPGVGAVSDFDGNYSIPLDPGTYSIRISFISFVTQTFKDVVIKPGEITVIDTEMKSSVDQLQAVEVVATIRRSSENGMLMEMKNAPNVVDGLASQSIRKAGDGDLSGAIKRVTGVTVQGGKYVYVRGLGDRYTKTTLDGMSIPGLDPDVNAVQIDIFPTSILENVAVYKSFTPDLYGDFTGGLVNIVTKKFPETHETQASIGLGFTPNQTFNSDYISYNGGKLDFLGIDDGTRKLPFDKTTVIPQEVLNNPELENITRSFNPNLSTLKKTALPNGSFSFRTGNQLNKENGKTYGYNVVLNYNNSTNFYSDFETNTFLKNNNRSVNELFKDESRTGIVGQNTVQWSALASGGYKKGNTNINAILLHSQSAESTASDRTVRNFNQTGAILIEDILTYSQRSLTSFILSGKHNLGKMQVEWSNAFSLSRVYDPDFRSTAYSITTGDTTLNIGDGAGINRFWRDLHEVNENFKVDLTYMLSPKIKLRGGVNGLLKWRQFETLRYNHNRKNRSDVSGNPNWFLEPDNIWTTDNNEGTYTIGNFEPANNYDAQQNVFAGYIMAEHSVFEKLKAIYGLRVEKGDMYYSGQNSSGSVIYSNEKTLDEINFLPSVNLVYSVTDKTNLRASATQTIARPSFKEKSISQIYDPITKRTFVGNIDLKQTEIWNYDLRYEWFFGPRELFSIAGFYKSFDGHIEMVAFETAPDNLKPRNSGMASVLGAELEIRKQLGFIAGNSSKFFNRLFIGGNITLVQSKVDMRDVETGNDNQTEYALRQNNLREGEKIDFYRDMAGQSPYAINTNLSYEILDKELSVSFAFNVQGEQLSIIGSGRIPDVYTLPFNSFDFNTYYSFGKDYRSKINVGIQNILDDDRTLIYRSYGSIDEIYQTYKPGRTFNVKYIYTF